MKKISIAIVATIGFAGSVPAQTNDEERDHAVDQLVGSWVYETCSEEAQCQTIERDYQPAAAGNLYYYTETVGEEEREGFVGYDPEEGALVEYDYPESWSREEFEHSYMADESTVDLYGNYGIEGEGRSLAQWRMNEDGSSMSMDAIGDSIDGGPQNALGVIFSRVPIVGDDPIIGPGSND